jgi:hypothetical protein
VESTVLDDYLFLFCSKISIHNRGNVGCHERDGLILLALHFFLFLFLFVVLIQNCPPPSGMPGYVVVENIRRVIHHFGQITSFKAYLEINESKDWKRALRSELQSSGVSLTDCPHNGRKDAADKMIMVDMLAFAIDNPPPATIVLISGDRDFVYALSTLRNRRYTIVLIVPNKGAPIILRSQANAILEWRYDVLNQDVWALQQQQVLQASSTSGTSPSSAGTATSGAPLLAQNATASSLSEVTSPEDDPLDESSGRDVTGPTGSAGAWRRPLNPDASASGSRLGKSNGAGPFAGVQSPVGARKSTAAAAPPSVPTTVADSLRVQTSRLYHDIVHQSLKAALGNTASATTTTSSDNSSIQGSGSSTGGSANAGSGPIDVPSASTMSDDLSSDASSGARRHDQPPPLITTTDTMGLSGSQYAVLESEFSSFCFSPKAPGFFDLLVEVMEKMRLQGEPKPRRSKVGMELIQRNPLLYQRAGCSSFKGKHDVLGRAFV